MERKCNTCRYSDNKNNKCIKSNSCDGDLTEWAPIYGSCMDCRHMGRYNDFEYECKRDGNLGYAYLHTFFRLQEHSCFEPRKQEEKKTTWYLHKVLNQRLPSIDYYEEHKCLTTNKEPPLRQQLTLLSTKQIETSETDIKKIWKELNK